jgi:phosphatidylglycerophosphate synthase
MNNKVPDEYNNDVDKLLYGMSDDISDNLKSLNCINPNHITTVGLIFGILGVVFFARGQWIESIICLWIYYFTDCLDGLYARKYDMVTKAGDYYDHLRDWTVTGLFFYMIYTSLKSTNQKTTFIVLASITVITSMIYVGCQEKLGEVFTEYRKVQPEDSSPTLQMFKCLTPDDPTTIMPYIKHFGPSSVVILITIYIIYIHTFKPTK